MIRALFRLVYSPIDLMVTVTLAAWWKGPPAEVMVVCLLGVPIVLAFVGGLFGVTPTIDHNRLMNWHQYSAKYPDATESMYEGYLRERGHGNLPWGAPK